MKKIREAFSKTLGRKVSQGEFAKLLGVSKSAVVSLEVGRLAIGEKMRMRIAAVTGSDGIQPLYLRAVAGAPQFAGGTIPGVRLVFTARKP